MPIWLEFKESKPGRPWQAIKRNAKRFPEDFLFQLATVESAVLRSENVISKGQRGGRRYPPYAFTEHRAANYGKVSL
jgi:hypothetical protein